MIQGRLYTRGTGENDSILHSFLAEEATLPAIGSDREMIIGSAAMVAATIAEEPLSPDEHRHTIDIMAATEVAIRTKSV